MKKYLFLAFCLAIVSCKNSMEPNSTDAIMPLAVGNEWDYAGFFWINHTDQHQFYDTTKIVSS
ncbi:MAG TPA: hypothetical protein VET48_07535, partial [Steroidobacteraceae bacterium]|nr:hypothetical protein [Steroidobacteraceae bacterium]